MNKFWIGFLVVLLFGCKTQQPLVSEDVPLEGEITVTIDEDDFEERELDELVVSAPRTYTLPVYNPAEDRAWDLQHMDLDLRFDWINERVFGRADITMKPYFYDQSVISYG